MVRTLAALACAFAAAARRALRRRKTCPNRPMTMVVPFAAGGAVDVLGAHARARAPPKSSASRS